MKITGVIPARYASTRLPGKPLMDICGKPMIRHVYERCLLSKGLDEVIVATDDERILEAVQGFGGVAVMTSPDHPNGTSRAAEVIRSRNADVVINIQGDEPLIDPRMIDELAEVFLDGGDVQSATLCSSIEDDSKLGDPNVVKVVRDLNGFALYFSRSMIPYPRRSVGNSVFEHIGIYGYTRDFLLKYVELEDTPLSEAESLEQLKILEHGYRMKVVDSAYPHVASGIDTVEDIEAARRVLEA